MERDTRLCDSSNDVEGIDTGLSSLSLNDASGTRPENYKACAKSGATKPLKDPRELPIIIQAMRKIREGILASHRIDDFALGVYKFIIRATILQKHMPSYHPALLHLLHKLYPVLPLSAAELDDFVGYHILDLACRQDDLAAAYAARHRYGYMNCRVELVLKTLVHGNWFMFWKLKASMDECQKCLMDSADERVRKSALNALGKGYLKIQRQYMEHAMGCAWERLKDQDKVSWVREGEMIRMRRAQRK